ncbi:Lig chan, ANF receptor and/or SBP bac 3 domain containing protein, partial [Asbolus verrucosus]
MIERIPNLAGVFVSESSWASPIVQSITSKLSLPYVQTNWRQSSSYIGGPTALNFYPDFDLLALGLAKLVESLQWKSFIVLYHDFEGFMRIQEILKLQKFQDKYRKNIIVQKFNFDEDIRSVLKQIKQSGEHHIILDCETDRIMEVLEQAKSVGIMSLVYQYFLTSLDAHTLDFNALKVDANITTLRIMNPETEDFNNIIRSWEFNDYSFNRIDPYSVKTETMLIHESINLMVEAVKDIIYQDGNIKFNNISCRSSEKLNYGSRIISYMNSHYMRSASIGNLSFTDTGRRKNFTLYLIEGNRHEILATWDSINPEAINVIRSEEEMTKKRQETLQAGINIIASRLEKPYLMYKKDHHRFTGNDMYEGYAMDLMTNISTILNFSFEFLIVEDNKNGLYNEIIQSWDGIIGEIVNGNALFGVGDMTITAERETAVDFSMPYMRLGIGILLQKPKTTVDMFAFLNPLSAEVWMYTVTLYLTVSIILYFVARMAPGDWENPHPCNLTPDELENLWSISNCLWLTMGSIMNQGSDILPKLVTSMWWFFALIMTNSYIASLAAFLTAKGSIIDDLEDLAKQNKIKYGTLEGGSTQDFFRQSNYSTYRRMYANMRLSKPSVFVKSTEEGVNRVISTKDGMYAFLMESSTIDYRIERDCGLTTVENKYFNNIEYGIAMPLDCPYRSDINDAILKLQEQGVLTDLKNKWWRELDGGETCPILHKESELKLENVGGIFVVLGIGVAVALFLGIVEFLWTVRRTSIEE